MNQFPSIHIEKLQLDLRGLPRATAEAVPSHLGEALTQALTHHPLSAGQCLPQPGPLRVRLDPGEASPRGIAQNIAQTLVRALGPGQPPQLRVTSTLT